MFITLAHVLFFEEKDSCQRHDIQETVVSLLQMGHQKEEIAQDFCGGTKNQHLHQSTSVTAKLFSILHLFVVALCAL